MSDSPIPPPAPESDPEARYRAVRELSPDAPGELSRLLAYLSDESWRVRRMVVERVTTSAEPSRIVPDLLAALADGENAGRRNAASDALVALGAVAIEPLSAVLKSTDADVRKLAADALGEIGDVRAVGVLAHAVADPDRNVRAAAAEALGKIGGTDAAGALEGALRQDDQTLRLAALDALERAGHTPPISVLAPLAQDPFLRRPLFRLLGVLSDPVALELLLSGLRDHARGTREAALAALAKQRKHRGDEGYASLARRVRDLAHAAPEVAQGARAALVSEDPLVAEGALWALAMIQDAGAAVDMARAGARDRVREEAITALVALGQGAGPALVVSLASLPPGGRTTAISALARLREWSAVAPLTALAGGGEADERVLAIEALGDLGDPQAVPMLSKLLDDESVAPTAARALAFIGRREPSVVRDEVNRRLSKVVTPWLLRLLGELGGPDDLARLREASRSPEASVRVAALDAVAALRLSAGGELVAHGLADEDSRVRAAAAKGLATFDSAEARRVLRVALRDGDAQVAAAAASSLALLGAREAAPDLLALLDRPVSGQGGPEVLPALAAIRAVVRLGALDAEALGHAVRHADAEVVKEALTGAPAIPQAGPALLIAAAHARWDVRAAAARAIAETGDRSLLPGLENQARQESDRVAQAAQADAIRVLSSRPA